MPRPRRSRPPPSPPTPATAPPPLPPTAGATAPRSAHFGRSGQQSFDERTTALGNASRRIFESLGCWSALAPEAAAIRVIHVSEAGRFGFARLDAAEQGIDAFGYVVANRAIGAALWERLRGASDLTLRVPARAEEVAINADTAELTVA